MEEIVCCSCGDVFERSARHKNQCYCWKPACQRARKAAWKRHKMRTDADYRFTQRASNKKWARSHPGYWKAYRRDHPEKAERNRLLQSIRNRRARAAQCVQESQEGLIAKMDASNADNFEVLGRFWMVPVIAKMDASKSDNFQILGQFWLLPVIAKMDALKVNIIKIPICYP